MGHPSARSRDRDRPHTEGREAFDRLERVQPHRFRVHEDHVRFDHVQIDATGQDLGDRLGQPPRACMVVHDPGPAFVERDQAGGGHDPRLAPGAAVEDPDPPGLADQLGRPADQ